MKNELIEEARYIMSLALSFTHPDFEDTYPEWSSVYSFAESVLDELTNKRKEETKCSSYKVF